MYWILMVIYIILNSLGLYLLKSGFNNLGEFSFSFSLFIKCIHSFRIISGFIIYIMSFLTWLILIAKTEISYAIPIMIGLLYISTAFVAFIFLKESLNPQKIVGMLLIGVGVILIILTKQVNL